MKEMWDGVVKVDEFFVIFVWVPACGRALPGGRIAVDTAETGEYHSPHAGRISSKSEASGGGGLVQGAQERRALKTRGMGKGTHTFYRVTTVYTDSE